MSGKSSDGCKKDGSSGFNHEKKQIIGKQYTKVFVTGGIEELEGHYYDCTTSKKVDTFVTNMKSIKENVGMTYTNGGDIRDTLDGETKFFIGKPIVSEITYIDIVFSLATH